MEAEWYKDGYSTGWLQPNAPLCGFQMISFQTSLEEIPEFKWLNYTVFPTKSLSSSAAQFGPVRSWSNISASDFLVVCLQVCSAPFQFLHKREKSIIHDFEANSSITRNTKEQFSVVSCIFQFRKAICRSQTWSRSNVRLSTTMREGHADASWPTEREGLTHGPMFEQHENTFTTDRLGWNKEISASGCLYFLAEDSETHVMIGIRLVVMCLGEFWLNLSHLLRLSICLTQFLSCGSCNM